MDGPQCDHSGGPVDSVRCRKKRALKGAYSPSTGLGGATLEINGLQTKHPRVRDRAARFPENRRGLRLRGQGENFAHRRHGGTGIHAADQHARKPDIVGVTGLDFRNACL
ncbi:MAG: hypothetical protein M0P69_22150 [Bacteroidales bacterium]|nr:hypothetical protein [Bacteroidales bacterium]